MSETDQQTEIIRSTGSPSRRDRRVGIAFQFFVSAEFRRQIEEVAIDEGITSTDVVRKAVKSYLDRHLRAKAKRDLLDREKAASVILKELDAARAEEELRERRYGVHRTAGSGSG